MVNEPNARSEPESDLGMAASDLAYRSLDEVVHPGHEEHVEDESSDDSSEEQHDSS